MNLIFRLARLLLAAALRRTRIDLLDEAALPLRAWPTDLDLNLHLTNSRYLSMMDLGRIDLLARAGVLGPLLRRRWQPLVGSVAVRYHRPIDPFQRFVLTTRLLCWDEKWFYIEQRFEANGRLATLAYVRGLFRGPRGNVTPQEVLAAGGLGERPSPTPPTVVTEWQHMESDIDAQIAAARRAA